MKKEFNLKIIIIILFNLNVFLCFVCLLVELVFALKLDSLALLADGFHNVKNIIDYLFCDVCSEEEFFFENHFC